MRLIDADALGIGKCSPEYLTTAYCAGWNGVIDIINTAPTIEAEPVKHGRWVLGHVPTGFCTPGGNRPWLCSECEYLVSWRLDKPNSNYCPDCGCKMDLEG